MPRSIVFLTQAQIRAQARARAKVRDKKAYTSRPLRGIPARLVGAADPGHPLGNRPPPPRTDRFGRVLSPVPTVLARKPKRVKPKPKFQANKRAPIKAPVRATRGTASTIPVHATTPAQKSRTIRDATPAQKARAPVRRPAARLTPSPQVMSGAPSAPELSDADLVQQSLDPLYLQIDQEQQRQQRIEQQRVALIQSLTGEMMGKLGQIAPQVAADYAQAGNTTVALAREGQQALAAASTNPQTQADLSAIGAPPEQQAQQAAQAQNVFQGGGAVLFGQQGLVPGQDLAARGAAATAYSRNLPGIAGLQGMLGMRQAFFDAAEGNRQLTDQRAQVAARAPSLLLDIQNARASQAAKERALQLEEVGLGLRTRAQFFNEKATTTRLGLEKARVGLSALQADRNWQAQLKRLGISEASLKLRAAQVQDKLNGGGFTKSQVLGLQKRAGQIASDAWNGVPVREGGEIVGYNHLTYQHAMSEMLAQGIPLTVAQQALNTFWSKPGMVAPFERDPNGGRLGGAGRPLLNYQQRQTRAKKPKRPKRR